MKIVHKTTASATGGRDGGAATADGTLNVKLTTPEELGGPGGDGNNHEQLFPAALRRWVQGSDKHL